MITSEMLEFDRNHIWHPYTSMTNPLIVYPVESAVGSRITLTDGRVLIDGMSSWWSAIHGYNVPRLNEALRIQSEKMNHIMFGGLTHQPAIELSQLLIKITPKPLQHIFLADSGSIAVEVALKMAIQYQVNRGKSSKRRFGALRKGYHGDTFGAMSVSDPETGMHHLFGDTIATNHFLPAPTTPFGEQLNGVDRENIHQFFKKNSNELAAILIEPIVQGAGGMRFYSAEYIKELRTLCSENDVLLIADEIATGFGRTGKLFACEHAAIVPDILCLGKALTGGQMTLAATLTTTAVAHQICAEDSVLMHGPTFMANPLACAVALESTKILLESPWQDRVVSIASYLKDSLMHLESVPGVSNVRTLGAIGVIETKTPVIMNHIQPLIVDAGIWIRPFGKLIYTMPAFTIEKNELEKLGESTGHIVKKYLKIN